MKQLILIPSLFVLIGNFPAHALMCSSYEIQIGCHTEFGAPVPGIPHGRPYCECPINREAEGEDLKGRVF